MAKTHNDELRRTLLALVSSKSTTIRDAAARVGVSYSTATRWVHHARTQALVPIKPAFAELVRESAAEAAIVVRVGGAEIAVTRGADLGLLQLVVHALINGASS